MGKNKHKITSINLDACEVTRFIFGIAVSTYCCILFFAMPLIYHNRYYDIGSFKYTMFMYITVSFLLFSTVMSFIYFVVLIVKKHINAESVREFLLSFSVIDLFVLAFVIASMLSFILSPNRTAEFPRFFLLTGRAPDHIINLPWEGYKDWNMGLRSQLMFAAVYFLVSRLFLKSWKWDLIFVMLTSGAAVFLFGILHRFHIDPLGLYEGLSEYYMLKFLSTLGQSTWYSSYMVLIIPVGMVFFLYSSGKSHLKKAVLGIFNALSAATFVTQNSDSAYLAFLSSVVIMFAVSFNDNERFLNFLDLIIIMLSSIKFIGILQICFPQKASALDSLSFFMSKSAATWILLILIVIFRIWISRRMDGGLKIHDFSKVRNVIIAAVIICIPLGVIAGCLNTAGLIPFEPVKNAEYLNFNDRWGNNRGYTWRNTVELMGEDTWRSMALTGPGPDCYPTVAYATEPRASELLSFWAGEVVVCCHNEWLNMLFNEGILGFIAYLGIFVSSFIIFIKKTEDPLMICAAAAVLAYFLHNFFCYQQILCTPIIFCIIALAQWSGRNPEINGKEQ
ncbi:MAG: O-antigen ligase family protein [Lachnospiraceae bacterium]|nr:O-antigen ligase family protein [Lachnospiraceae bacterium]